MKYCYYKEQNNLYELRDDIDKEIIDLKAEIGKLQEELEKKITIRNKYQEEIIRNRSIFLENKFKKENAEQMVMDKLKYYKDNGLDLPIEILESYKFKPSRYSLVEFLLMENYKIDYDKEIVVFRKEN